jgi:diamine N-acetyltransferase
MITIVNATGDDFENIRDLAFTIWPIAYKDVISASQIEYMLNMMYSVDAIKEQVLHKNHQFIIAKENDYVGFASYQLDCNEKGKTKIHKLYVLSNIQGKGIGKKMVDYIMIQAKLNNQMAVFLNVNKKNKAQFFYKNLGFEIDFEEVIAIGQGYIMDDYVMEKKI